MAIRKLKNAGRRKAQFGSQEAAILGAAAISAAASYGAARIGASAAKDAAKAQAQAVTDQAKKQADAIKLQNQNSVELQTKSQEFIKEQNAENRELQKDIQMQLQILAGHQNETDRLEASKMQVKNGGSTRRKLRRAGNATTLLQGSDNMPFVVTDGGGVQFVGSTPEGFDLYEIKGNDHEHYHKTKGGKNKTGVGIKFADGNVIEGEGNQNGNQGEYLLNTPNNAYFISRHSIAGVNPAKMVNGGMHPLKAYAIQERLKAANGISDDGKHNSSPVKKMMGGIPNQFDFMINATGPQMGVDTVGDTTVGVASKFTDEKRTLKCGGKARRKAASGFALSDFWTNPSLGNNRDTNFWTSPTILNAQTAESFWENPSLSNKKSSTGGWLTRNADFLGAGIGALGNIGGALVTASANRSAARYLSDAQLQAAATMADAYRSLKGIDMNSIRREDYAAAHTMPVLQAPISFAQQGIAKIDRSLQRRLANAGRYSASSAAGIDRMNRAEIDAQDARNQVYSEDQKQMQNIRQANAERISRAGEVNAQLDAQANREHAGAYLQGLMYNADVYNQSRLGEAGALSEGAINSANTLANARTSNAQAWANALVGSTQGFTNSLSAMSDRRNKLAAALLGAGSDSQASYYATLASRGEARQLYDALVAQYNATKDKDTKKRLARQINNIASKRGLKLV